MTTAKRRGNGEGSAPYQRADGRWQVLLSYRDEYGQRKRHTVTGKDQADVRKKARAKAREDRAGPVAARAAHDGGRVG